LFEAA